MKFEFIVVVKLSKARSFIKVMADDYGKAADMVCNAEGCNQSNIISIQLFRLCK